MGSESTTETLRHWLLSSADANCEKAVRWSGALGAELSNFDAKYFSDSNYTLLSNYLWRYQALSIPRQILTSSDRRSVAQRFSIPKNSPEHDVVVRSGYSCSWW